MVYYDENDNIMDESQVDLAHGYLTDRTIEHHDEVAEVYHYVESDPLPSGATMKKKVIDVPYQPAWDEVTSQTYHYTGPTEEEKMRADIDKTMEDVANMQPGELAYSVKSIVTADAWTTMITKKVVKGSYHVDTDADEYRITKGTEEIVDGFIPEDSYIAVDVKANAIGTYYASLIKE